MSTTTVPRYTGSFDAEGNGVMTVIIDGKPVTFTSEHPHWDRLLADISQGKVPEDTNFEIVLEAIPGVEVDEGVLYIHGYPTNDALAHTIKRYHREGRDTTNLGRFAARLQENPSEASREALFTWAAVQNDLTIDAEGYIIGFKSVTVDMRSHHVGPAIVNGEYYDPFNDELESGKRRGVPNTIGSVVELDREDVDPDVGVACSTGLHFGTWSYAKNFGRNNMIMEVRVDPADVVSVPQDSGFQKVRCCRYEVVEIHDYQGILERYEPEATAEDPSDKIAEGLAAQNVPSTFVERILDRLKRRS